MSFHHTWCQQVSCTSRGLYRDAGWGQLVESEPWGRNKPEQASGTPFPELLLLMMDSFPSPPGSCFPVTCRLPMGSEPGVDPRPSCAARAEPSASFASQGPEFLLLPERRGQHRKTWGTHSENTAPAPSTLEAACLEESVPKPSQESQDPVFGDLVMACLL